MSSHGNRPVSPPSFTEPVPSISDLSSDLLSLPHESSSGTTSYGHDKGPEAQNITQIQGEVQARGKSRGHAITINMLPDDVLLDIFDSYRKSHASYRPPSTAVWRWHELVHVCQRWRQIVFGSPRRLDLHIVFTNGTLGGNLDCWPPLPIAIQYSDDITFTPHDKDRLFATLEHRGRIRHVDLCLAGPLLEEVARMMQEPFPVLAHLTLQWEDERPVDLPSGFLGGSAPSLQYMHLEGIPFPALSSFLLSTSNLVDLRLTDIPQDGYISPWAMVTSLSMLPKLKSFVLGSQSATSNSGRIRLPPVRRTLLPALTYFQFEGDSDYLEEFVSVIDSPQLNRISVRYLGPFLDFQVEQLFKFLDLSEDPESTLIWHADITLLRPWVAFKIYPCPESRPYGRSINASIICPRVREQISLVAQVFSQPSALLSRVVHLKFSRYLAQTDRHDSELLHLLRQFSAVRTLHVSWGFAGCIALALEAVTEEMVAEVLPVVDLIYLDGQPPSSIEKFLAARQLSDHPLTIVDTEAEFYERVKSYVSG